MSVRRVVDLGRTLAVAGAAAVGVLVVAVPLIILRGIVAVVRRARDVR